MIRGSDPARTPAGARPDEEQVLAGNPMALVAYRPELLTNEEWTHHWTRALRARGTHGSPSTLQVYVHVAYCSMSCRFCQYFHAVPRSSDALDALADQLAARIRRTTASLGRVQATNAYFGGGTPTALPARALARVLDAFRDGFDVQHELTCESHPATLDAEKLDLLAAHGINRLSLGVQSFDAEVLRRIGRTNPESARTAELARAAQSRGMRVNIDLVAGLPQQTMASLEADIARLLTWRPDSITVYRYQPVRRLLEAPSDALALRRIGRPRVLARVLLAGYAAVPPRPRDDDTSWILLSLGSRRNASQAANEIGAALSRANEVRHYTNHDSHEVHLMGLGPGAVSHLHGGGWFRDASAPATTAAAAASETVMWGTKLTPNDECRLGLARGLLAGRRVSLRALSDATGGDPEAALAAIDASAVERRGDGVRLRNRLTRPAATDALRALLPSRDHGEDARADAASTLVAIRRRPDVAPELVRSALTHAEGSQARGDLVAMRALLRRLDLTEGSAFAGAKLERAAEGELTFRVEDAPAPALAVRTVRPGTAASYAQSREVALVHLTRPRAPLTARELSLLEALVGALRAAEARESR